MALESTHIRDVRFMLSVAINGKADFYTKIRLVKNMLKDVIFSYCRWET